MFSLATGVLDAPDPGGRPARWAATGRWGGASRSPFATLNLAGYVGDVEQDVVANRDRVASWVGAHGLAVMDAVHGSDVAVVTTRGVVAGVDALITQEPGLAVAALGADCVPLALSGADGRTVAAAHCGWRGLVADVVGAVVAGMGELGTRVDRVILGASVCGAHYPVPPVRAEELRDRCSAAVAAAALVACPDGQPGIDEAGGVVARLAECGVPAPSVVRVAGCTVADDGLFSYRRDGHTGRQGIAIARMVA